MALVRGGVRIRIVVIPVCHLDPVELNDGRDGSLETAPFLGKAHSTRPQRHDQWTLPTHLPASLSITLFSAELAS